MQVNPWDPFIFSLKKTTRKQASFPGAADTVHAESTRARLGVPSCRRRLRSQQAAGERTVLVPVQSWDGKAVNEVTSAACLCGFGVQFCLR